jgi:hypothetical protein
VMGGDVLWNGGLHLGWGLDNWTSGLWLEFMRLSASDIMNNENIFNLPISLCNYNERYGKGSWHICNYQSIRLLFQLEILPLGNNFEIYAHINTPFKILQIVKNTLLIWRPNPHTHQI